MHLYNLCPSSGPLPYMLTDADAAGVHVDDPDGAAPADDQALNLLVAPQLLLLQPLGGGRVERLLGIFGGLVRLDGLLVHPLGPALPHAGHGLPLVGLGPVDVPDALPGVVGIGAVEVELGAHDLDAVLVEPDDIAAGPGPLDGADGSLARVQHRVLARVGAHHAPQPSGGLRRGAGGGGGAPALGDTDRQDELAGEPAREVGPVALVLGREGDGLDGAGKVAQLDVLDVNERLDANVAIEGRGGDVDVVGWRVWDGVEVPGLPRGGGRVMGLGSGSAGPQGAGGGGLGDEPGGGLGLDGRQTGRVGGDGDGGDGGRVGVVDAQGLERGQLDHILRTESESALGGGRGEEGWVSVEGR